MLKSGPTKNKTKQNREKEKNLSILNVIFPRKYLAEFRKSFVGYNHKSYQSDAENNREFRKIYAEKIANSANLYQYCEIRQSAVDKNRDFYQSGAAKTRILQISHLEKK